MRLQIESGRFEDGSVGYGAVGVDLRSIIWRWVRGFHAALYREPVPGGSAFSLVPPLPEGRVTDRTVEPVPIAEVAPKLVEEIKRNRLTQTLDRVVVNNGRCRYECVWTQADSGRRICAWALDLYGWKDLGEPGHFKQRGCVGTYYLPDFRVPAAATLASRLMFAVRNTAPLDPFGD